jgi:anaerobic ribonucleoside-triphosphate reductase activating protein
MQDQVIKDLSNPYITGLTVSGGDCLHPRNAKDLLPFLQRVKLELPEKDIWCWTGHTFEELKNNLLQAQHLEYIDILVDGKFVKELYEPDLLFRGSSNQRIIDVQKSLTTNRICLYLEGNYK